MRLDVKDMARLWDMLDAVRTAVEFTKDLRFEDFLKDRKTRNAVERNLEIIGEAARCVSTETRENLHLLGTQVKHKASVHELFQEVF